MGNATWHCAHILGFGPVVWDSATGGTPTNETSTPTRIPATVRRLGKEKAVNNGGGQTEDLLRDVCPAGAPVAGRIDQGR